jgi:hypothetical protein
MVGGSREGVELTACKPMLRTGWLVGHTVDGNEVRLLSGSIRNRVSARFRHGLRGVYRRDELWEGILGNANEISRWEFGQSVKSPTVVI